MKKLLAVVIGCFVIATGYLAFIITERQTTFRDVAHHNDSWAVSQSVSEYMRLEHTLASHTLGVEGASLEEVKLRLDIVFGRLAILSQGTLRMLVDSSPRHPDILERLEAVLTRLDAGLDKASVPEIRAMLADMARLDAPLTALASYAVEYDARRIEVQYDALQRLHRFYIALAAGLILCGIALIVLLLYHNRLLDRAHRNLRHLAGDLGVASQKLRLQNERLAHAAHHDALTGLPNRTLFREELEARLAAAEAEGSTLAVLLLDLDGFKSVNDTLGHDTGDALLKAAAERIASLVPEDDLVCRLAGDEFVILSTVVSERQALDHANMLLAAMAESYSLAGREVATAASIGVTLSQPGLQPDVLFKQADLALYEAKASGRGCVRLFRAELHARIEDRMLFEIDLRKALEHRQMELFYQPVVDTVSRSVCGYEALLRWNHPQRGRVPPSQFIPIAEALGLIHELGEWVLRTACFEATRWQAPLKVAVNLSPVQFRNPALARTVISALADSGLDPNRLELEITESVLLDRNADHLAILRDLKTRGISIAMDDFGTGYSSLASLRSFPFDRIKIDQSFIRDVTTGPSALVIVEMTVDIARKLGMATTAEGIETEEQYDCLRRLGCDQLQGYLFGQPMPASAVDVLADAAPRASFHPRRGVS